MTRVTVYTIYWIVSQRIMIGLSTNHDRLPNGSKTFTQLIEDSLPTDQKLFVNEPETFAQPIKDFSLTNQESLTPIIKYSFTIDIMLLLTYLGFFL